MNDYIWQGALMAIQACIGAGVGVAVRSLRGIHADVERISEHLRVMNGRLGKLRIANLADVARSEDPVLQYVRK